MNVAKNACNPYAAPQVVRTLLPLKLPVAIDRRAFPWALVQQGLRYGFTAGVTASLVMLSVFLLRAYAGSDSSYRDFLGTCFCFILATSAFGLFWGFNHAIIVWVLRRWSFATGNDDLIEI